MTLTKAAFIDSDLVDIRRFAGYPLYGTGTIVFPFPWWFTYYQALEVRLQNMTANEGVVTQTYLTNLRALDAAIPAMSANIGTAAASVWTRNPQELKERTRLYAVYRMQFCEFLGVPAGPGLKGSGSGNNMSITV